MGQALLIPLVLLIGLAAGAALAWRRNRPARRALEAIRGVAEQVAAGDWRPRLELDARAPAAARRIADLHDRVADRTLRQLKNLSRQRDDLRALVDALPDPLLLADTARRVIRINRPAAELLGVPADLALGRPLEAVVSDPAVLALFDQTAEIDKQTTGADGRPVLPLRRSLRLSRGGRRLAFQAVATRSAAGGVLVVLRDISTLDQTLRMKSDFVANAGHELRTPVSAIKAAFETLGDVLGDDAPPPKMVGRCLSILGGQVQRLEDMLQDLMDLSRVESGEAKPVHEPLRIGELARDLRQTLGAVAAEKHIDLSLPAGESAAIEFVSDRRLLTLALKNLVENAVKYTPPGGRVAMTAERHDLPDDAAELHRHLTDRPYHEIVFRVSDTGVGIAADQIGRVFERFYQIDPARTGTNAASGRGTGLGLSIVKHAATALGGGVRVESVLGKGSTFTLTLPQAAAAPERE